MGNAGYGNHTEDPKVSTERPDKNAADSKPQGGQDRPGFDLGGSDDRGSQAAKDLPASGPHGKEHLINEDATPGAGALPAAGDKDATDSTSG